jgi:hypothetical protein
MVAFFDKHPEDKLSEEDEKVVLDLIQEVKHTRLLLYVLRFYIFFA